MSTAEVKQNTCENCGVNIRENTLFCYNCGSSLDRSFAGDAVPEIEQNGTAMKNGAETNAALADLAARFKIEDSDPDDKLAKAAAERKKARIKQRKPVEFVWQPAEASSSRVVVLLAILMTVIAAAAVYLTIFRK